MLKRFGQSMQVNSSGYPRKACRGHSMVEVLLSLIFFAPALLVVVLLGKYLDIKNTTREAARYAVWERTVWSDSGEWYAEENTKSDDRIRLEIDRRLYGHPSQGLDSREDELARGITDNPLWTTVDTELPMFDETEQGDTGSEDSETGEHPLLNGVEAGGRTLRAQLELYENEPPSSLVVDEVAERMNLGERNFAVATVMTPVENHTVFGDDLVMRAHAAILTNTWSGPSEDIFVDRIDEVVYDGAASAITAPGPVIAGIGAVAGLYIDGFDAHRVDESVDSTVLPDYLLRDEARDGSTSSQSASTSSQNGQSGTTTTSSADGSTSSSSTTESTSTSEDDGAASDGDQSESGSDTSTSESDETASEPDESTSASNQSEQIDCIEGCIIEFQREDDEIDEHLIEGSRVCVFSREFAGCELNLGMEIRLLLARNQDRYRECTSGCLLPN